MSIQTIQEKKKAYANNCSEKTWQLHYSSSPIALQLALWGSSNSVNECHFLNVLLDLFSPVQRSAVLHPSDNGINQSISIDFWLLYFQWFYFVTMKRDETIFGFNFWHRYSAIETICYGIYLTIAICLWNTLRINTVTYWIR